MKFAPIESTYLQVPNKNLYLKLSSDPYQRELTVFIFKSATKILVSETHLKTSSLQTFSNGHLQIFFHGYLQMFFHGHLQIFLQPTRGGIGLATKLTDKQTVFKYLIFSLC